jgi:hypothetical protein
LKVAASAFPLTAAALLSGCTRPQAFDSEAWKADALTERHQLASVRRNMLPAIERRFPKGTDRSAVLAALGPADESGSGFCELRPPLDSCLVYDLGIESADYDFYVFEFANGRLVHSYFRPT